jgi:hypothetical protein
MHVRGWAGILDTTLPYGFLRRVNARTVGPRKTMALGEVGSRFAVLAMQFGIAGIQEQAYYPTRGRKLS